MAPRTKSHAMLSPPIRDSVLPEVNPAVIFKAMSDGAVLFDPHTEIYFGLNEVGVRIWELLPPKCESLNDLCAQLRVLYPEVPESTLRHDASELLDELVKQGLATMPA